MKQPPRPPGPPPPNLLRNLPALPADWVERLDVASGRIYFEHLVDGRTTWERPSADADAAPCPPRSAVDELSARAARGEPAAQAELALYCFRGDHGVPKDAARALALVDSAARAGDACAQFRLGALHERGHGELVTRDAREAARLYGLAADQGLAAAQNALGALYQRGDGVVRDARRADSYYRRAAAQGCAPARDNLRARAVPRAREPDAPAPRAGKRPGPSKPDVKRAMREMYQRCYADDDEGD